MVDKNTFQNKLQKLIAKFEKDKNHYNCTNLQGDSYNFSGVFVNTPPIRTIDFNNPTEKAAHDKLISHVDCVLDLHNKKAALSLSAERQKIECEIAVTDENISEVVFGLYGITKEERMLDEGT